jgi:hypothetical protein
MTTSDAELYEGAVEDQLTIFRVQQEAKRRLAAETDEDISLEDYHSVSKKIQKTEWLIEDYLELGCVGFISGEYQTGKSFLALDWALSLAAGIDWMGHSVPEPSRILYIAGEGYASVGKRSAVWAKGHDTSPERGSASFILKPVQFVNQNMVEKLTKLVVDHAIDLVVIDTLARSTTGLSENDSLDMGLFLDGCFRLRDARGELMTTVVVVHHFGKDSKRGARGHSRLIADADFNYEVREDKDVAGWVLHCDKLKEDAHPDDWAFTLKEIELDSGIHSCIIQENATGNISVQDSRFTESQGINHAVLNQSAKAAKTRKVKHSRKLEQDSQRLAEVEARLGPDATEMEIAEAIGFTRKALYNMRQRLLHDGLRS